MAELKEDYWLWVDIKPTRGHQWITDEEAREDWTLSDHILCEHISKNLVVCWDRRGLYSVYLHRDLLDGPVPIEKAE